MDRIKHQFTNEQRLKAQAFRAFAVQNTHATALARCRVHRANHAHNYQNEIAACNF
jgi:hypothetical protein